MTEQHCDNYLTKLNEIKTACINNQTTITQLDTLINELDTISNEIDTDLTTMSIPSTMAHFNKFITIQNLRCTKIMLQGSLLNLIKIKTAHLRTINIINADLSAVHDYEADINSIKVLSNTVMSSCDCMNLRKIIIEELNKL